MKARDEVMIRRIGRVLRKVAMKSITMDAQFLLCSDLFTVTQMLVHADRGGADILLDEIESRFGIKGEDDLL